MWLAPTAKSPAHTVSIYSICKSIHPVSGPNQVNPPPTTFLRIQNPVCSQPSMSLFSFHSHCSYSKSLLFHWSPRLILMISWITQVTLLTYLFCLQKLPRQKYPSGRENLPFFLSDTNFHILISVSLVHYR